MKQAKRKGYILILVMMALLLIGAELFVLAGISQSMIFQTRAAYLDAQRRNIAASTAAWKKHHHGGSSEPVELDMTELNIPKTARVHPNQE